MNNNFANMTKEEREKMLREGSERKAAERKARIDAAIKAGAKVKYVNHPISREEQETQINMTDLQTNEVSIYSTVSTDINKIIDNGYKITEIIYYNTGSKHPDNTGSKHPDKAGSKHPDKADNRLCGIGATTTRNKISLRNDIRNNTEV